MASTSILETLNSAQRRAVCSDASTVAILAGPGSGKTHTLTSRVAWLVDAVGYKPEDVIVATFTVKAAREMKERIGKALGNGRENKLVLGTFHSIARRYLVAYGKRIGLDPNFNIAGDADSRAIINRICKRLQLGLDPIMARGWIGKKKSKGMDEKKPDEKKQPKRQGSGTSMAAELSNRELETCYQEYQHQLQQSNMLDYDDLLVRCVQLLKKCPSCVSNVHAVLIDEYQDTNGVQYELMKLFAQQQRRITVVGDPDQSIYGWRSAEIRNLYRLLHDYPGTAEVSLEENYRSSQAILDMSLNVIQQDQKRYKKILKPVHDKGTRPTLRRLKTSAVEGEWIVSEIRRITLMSGKMLGHGDVAILLRSASLSRHIESALGKSGIAYKMVGGFKFYDRVEIRVVLDYLRILHQPDNNDALARIINVPKRGVGDGTVKALVEEAETSSQSLWNLLAKHCRGDRAARTNITKAAEQKISGGLIRMFREIRQKIENPPNGTTFGLVDMIDSLLTQLGFDKYLTATYPEDHEQRWANVQELFALAKDFTRDLDLKAEETLPDIEGLEQVKDTDVLGRFLGNVSLASDVQTGDKDQEAKPMVTISTIHAAKGLEWPIVFVPAAYNGSIPHMRSDDGDEERRLLYVAMTRAQALLYLSCPLYGGSYSGGSGERLELSSFVAPIERSFDKKGPLLEKQRLETIGRILGRVTPTQESIYKSLPPSLSPHDDLISEDPENPYQASAGITASDNRAFTEGSRPKRPRLQGPASHAETAEESQWQKAYSTTMEQTSNFTVGSLPGFVTVGAHSMALATVPDTETNTNQRGAKDTKGKRPRDQRSLMDFVKKGPRQTDIITASGATLANLHQPKRQSPIQRPNVSVSQAPLGYAPYSAPKRPAIAPELSGHRLSASKVTAQRMAQPKREVQRSELQYAQFSSSPPRPPTREKTEITGAEGDVENMEPPPPESRPAASFHNTTMNMPKTLGGFRRPAGLAARDDAAALKKLRKPFKPVSMNRP